MTFNLVIHKQGSREVMSTSERESNESSHLEDDNQNSESIDKCPTQLETKEMSSSEIVQEKPASINETKEVFTPESGQGKPGNSEVQDEDTSVEVVSMEQETNESSQPEKEDANKNSESYPTGLEGAEENVQEKTGNSEDNNPSASNMETEEVSTLESGQRKPGNSEAQDEDTDMSVSDKRKERMKKLHELRLRKVIIVLIHEIS